MSGDNLKQDYIRVEIDSISDFGGGFDWDIYIKLSDQKMIKISNAGEDKGEVLDRFETRGVDAVYLLPEDYKRFSDAVKAELEAMNSGSGSDLSQEEKLKRLSAGSQVLKAIFAHGMIDEESKSIAREVTKGTLEVIGDSKLFKKFKDFKNNCTEEYMRSLMTGYVVSCMLQQFPWQTLQIKEKLVMASLLCDILLGEEDFKEMSEKGKNPKNLSKKVYQHPEMTAEILEKFKNFASSETITIVRQHHERPNGHGFPNGLHYPEITILSSIYIVGYYFVEKLHEHELENVDIPSVIAGLVAQIKDKFCSGNFRKASESLAKVFDTDGPGQDL